jgi:HD superfamily phosphohydrolase
MVTTTQNRRPFTTASAPLKFESALPDTADSPLRNPAEKILSEFTIDKVTPLSTEPHIQKLINDIKLSPGTDIDYCDPIHKNVTLPAWMVSVINTPPMLRLAEVGQMPLTGHSRLAHSIGVAILALKLAEGEFHLPKTDQETKKSALTQQEKMELSIIALLHDVGHGPYSHLYEKLYIRNKQDRFDHDQHRTKLIHSSALSLTLSNLGINPDMISEALAKPKEHWMAYLAKEILDRLDYNMRDSEYSSFRNENKEWIKAKTIKMLNYLELESGSVYFSPKGEKAIELFMFARGYTFNSLAYDPKVRIVESLISRAIRAKLAKLDSSKQHEYVEALSYLSDAQLNSLLPDKEQNALKPIFNGKPLPLIVSLTTEDISSAFRHKEAIKPKKVLEVFKDLSSFGPDITVLVAIAPAASPAMTFKIRKSDGEIISIRKDRGASTNAPSDHKQPQIGSLSIAAYDQKGFIEPSGDMISEVLRAFAKKGWLNGREHERVFTGWPGNWHSSEAFGFTEMPSGAEKEFEALAKNPSKATPQ